LKSGGKDIENKFPLTMKESPDFSLGTIGTKTAFSGISYEKSVQEKDPGNHEYSGYRALGL